MIKILKQFAKKIKSISEIFSRIDTLEERIMLLEEKNELLSKISSDQTKIIAALSAVQNEIATEILFASAYENKLKVAETKKFAVFITNSGSDDDFIN